jgi:hypothetical protein
MIEVLWSGLDLGWAVVGRVEGRRTSFREECSLIAIHLPRLLLFSAHHLAHAHPSFPAVSPD